MMSEGVTITTVMPVKPGTGEQFTAFLQEMIRGTAQRPGFRSARLLRHKDDKDRIMVLHSWDRAEDYEAYVKWRAMRGEIYSEKDAFASPATVDIWTTDVPWR